MDKKKFKVSITDNGDDYISSNFRHMWELAYHCLLVFQCPVIFNISGPDVPRRMNMNIHFFVPRDHRYCEEVIKYLEQELIDEVRDPDIIKIGKEEEWFWGVNVVISRFSGIDGYMDRETVKRLAEWGLKYLKEKFEKMKDAKNKTLQ